jgi:glutamate-1-semialdehyde 2,1-aminomutase
MEGAVLTDTFMRVTACLGDNPAPDCTPVQTFGLLLVGLLAAIVLALFLVRRVVTGVVTLRAWAWTPALSRRLSRWVRSRDYSIEEFLQADGAGDRWVDTRRNALDRLAAFFGTRYAKSGAWGNEVRDSFSDIRFADANRVPFPFARVMRDRFNLTTVVIASDGPRLRDLDGQWNLDVSGSYGLNVAGFDRYKEWIQRGWDRVKDLGPVLGPVHPLVSDNIVMLKAVSRLDEVSFHMSGTEAVMAAVRLARFNTRRRLIVCFSGAYHGWWDGVVAGLGSERPLDDCLTLKDLDPASLAVIRRRAHEIAGVLVNPLQSFHPNSPPPNDAVLLTSSVRKTQEATDRYARWLTDLRDVCRGSDVPLIFDEVFTGFRLAVGGGQEYFGVQADLVVYGKTVAGGLPIGVVCGTSALMRRFDPDHPMRLAYVVGTFSAHPSVMGAMYEFLQWVTRPATKALYDEMNERCASWVEATNRQLVDESLPLRVMHLGTIWTVLFKEPSRYNWLLQYYLRAEGMALSWVGTGRCMTSMDFSLDDYRALQEKLLQAAHHMRRDGWWLNAEQHPEREKHMRQRLLREMLGSLVPRPLKAFHAEVMRRKKDDHHASHSDPANQMLHLVSSSVFLYCYIIFFSDLTLTMCLGLGALFVRQFGHAVLEPACHDKEETLLGYNTRNKTLVVVGYLLIPVANMIAAGVWTFQGFMSRLPTIAEHWFIWTLVIVFGRVLYLMWKHNFFLSMVWYVKLVTDPITDVIAYFPRWPQRA